MPRTSAAETARRAEPKGIAVPAGVRHYERAARADPAAVDLQVHALARLRSGVLAADERRDTEELLQLTIGGVAAGLQHTG